MMSEYDQITRCELPCPNLTLVRRTHPDTHSLRSMHRQIFSLVDIQVRPVHDIVTVFDFDESHSVYT